MRSLIFFVTLICSLSLKAEEGLLIVARPIAAELSKDQCFDDEKVTDDGLVEICMNTAYEITYEIYRVLKGNYQSKTIRVMDYYHYSGMPDHLVVSPACVSLEKRGDLYVRLDTFRVKSPEIDNVQCATKEEQ